MKKLLFSIICIISIVGVANAKTQLKYEWGRYALYDNYIKDFNVYNDEIYYIADSPYVNKLDKDGKPVMERRLGSYDDTIHLLNGQIIYIKYAGSSFFRYIYDAEMKIIDILESTCLTSTAKTKGENDKYYYINDCFYKKDTHEEMKAEDIYNQHPLYEEAMEAYNNSDMEKANQLALKISKEEFSGTMVPIKLYYTTYSATKESWSSYFIVNAFHNEKGDFSFLFYDEQKETFVLELYNNNYEYINTIELKSDTTPYVLYRNDRLFVFGYESISEEQYEVNAVLTATEYLPNGTIISTNNLVNLNDREEYYGRFYDPREITYAKNTSDGFVFVTEKFVSGFELAPEIESGAEITSESPAMFKFTLSYEIETKDNKNGKIITNKETSKHGEKITFKVEPQKGYKLDKVIVTDDAGNSITVKDYTFTMPDSNVVVEAIFTVENPNTSVFVSGVISCLLLLASYVFIVLKNKKVKQYE